MAKQGDGKAESKSIMKILALNSLPNFAETRAATIFNFIRMEITVGVSARYFNTTESLHKATVANFWLQENKAGWHRVKRTTQEQ